jgi:hypothetical protein
MGGILCSCCASKYNAFSDAKKTTENGRPNG